MKAYRLSLSALVLAGCGTVAGNPKKPPAPGVEEPPPQPGTTEPQAAAYQLPLLDFDLQDDTLADDVTALALTEGDAIDKTLFNAYGRRFNNLTRELDETAKRINKLASDKGQKDAQGVLRFANAGAGGKLSGKVGPTSAAGFAYEAVLCAAGKPFQLLRWADGGGAVELWRDFSVAQGESEANYSVISRVTMTKAAGGDVTLALSSVGSWTDAADDDDEGTGLAERMLVTRHAGSAVLELKATSDRFTGATPATFDGDAYIVSRLYPKDGKKGFDATFVAYSKAAKRLACRNGFDEKSPELWHPRVGGPRFCLARQKGGAKLGNFAAFAELVSSFEGVGIVQKSEIEAVKMPLGLGCE